MRIPKPPSSACFRAAHRQYDGERGFGVAGDSDGLAVSATPGSLALRGALAQEPGVAVQRLLQTERKQPLQLTLVQVAAFGKILHLVVTHLE